MTGMHHPDIEAWLASRADAQRLKQLEEKAADEWFESLSLEQREVFAELIESYDGLFHLRERIVEARIKSQTRARKRRGDG
jgi:hypothetical protein